MHTELITRNSQLSVKFILQADKTELLVCVSLVFVPPRLHHCHTRMSTVGAWAFPVAAVWNSLPQHVTSTASVAVFQSHLKTHLFLHLIYHILVCSCFRHYNCLCYWLTVSTSMHNAVLCMHRLSADIPRQIATLDNKHDRCTVLAHINVYLAASADSWRRRWLVSRPISLWTELLNTLQEAVSIFHRLLLCYILQLRQVVDSSRPANRRRSTWHGFKFQHQRCCIQCLDVINIISWLGFKRFCFWWKTDKIKLAIVMRILFFGQNLTNSML